ncbi:hypothetical protein FRX31_008028 [Thalictrum thalictroides]|uniref:Uncharacterized protein n=1 Tax=Thalictrum thalictroides TaxID=46969 RepID=A0A7J6X0M2_THATH|nr:hypothetical protein FRX31_008028 [Thalictrum thalictroides]
MFGSHEKTKLGYLFSNSLLAYLVLAVSLSFAPLNNQLEKHQRADHELKKRVLKLEFCLQEARSHTRKLQRV